MEFLRKVSLNILVLTSFLFAVESLAAAPVNQTCQCEKRTEYNPKLPESHPENLCAAESKLAKVSWIDWVLGNSGSAQYHFMDLLELLSSENASMNSSPAIEN